MESVEIVIYMGIALIVGGMILNFIIGIDGKNMTENFSQIFKGKNNNIEYKKVTPVQFIKEIYLVWEKCGKGEMNIEETIYVNVLNTTPQISKEFIFNEIKKINYCTQLQSAKYNCGTKEDLILENNITLPAVVKISCSSEGIKILI